MVIYGLNVLKEMDKKRIKKVYTSRKDILSYLKDNNIKYEFVDKKKLDKMASGNNQGVVIEALEYDYYALDDIKGSFIVALDHLEDPHNFGAIIRTCVAAGIKEIIIPKDRSVQVNSTVVKTSVGMIEHIHIIMVSNLVMALKKLQEKGYYVYVSDMAGENYENIEYNLKKVLVIGNEGKGVSHLVKENSDALIKIPMAKEAESLNASVAAGILIYGMRDKSELE